MQMKDNLYVDVDQNTHIRKQNKKSFDQRSNERYLILTLIFKEIYSLHIAIVSNQQLMTMQENYGATKG